MVNSKGGQSAVSRDKSCLIEGAGLTFLIILESKPAEPCRRTLQPHEYPQTVFHITHDCIANFAPAGV